MISMNSSEQINYEEAMEAILVNPFAPAIRSGSFAGFWLAPGGCWFVMNDYGDLVEVDVLTFSNWVKEK